MMAFDALMPWWALAILAAGAIGVTARAYARPVVPMSSRVRLVLAGCRLSLLFLLIVILQRPVLLEPSDDRRDAIVPILVDVSRSMRLNDVGVGAGNRPRIDEAARIVENLAPAVAAAFDVEVLGFGESLAPVDPANLRADGRRSDLGGALRAIRERYRGRSIAGVVVVSDGGESGGDPSVQPEDGDPPVFAVGVGRPMIARDREVLDVTVGAPILANSAIDLRASIASHGFDDEPVEVRLLEDGRLVQVDRMTPTATGAPMPIAFRVSPKPDVATLYTVEVAEAGSELTGGNNAQRVLVPPPGRPRRILLVEGAPGYEHSFLKRAWLQDEAIELDSVVRKGANERGQDTFYIQGHPDRTPVLAAGYPQHRPALFAYDAVVLANVPAEFFTPDQLDMTADFVSTRGGGLLVLGAQTFSGRGFAATPLEEVLPLHASGRTAQIAPPATRVPNTVSLTEDGAHHGLMRLGATPAATRARWDAAPPLAGVAALGDPKPGASVLAHTVGAGGGLHPLVAVHRYGRGRAMVFTGEASWRWKMLLPSDDDTYDTFWRQSARWLTDGTPGPVTLAIAGGRVPGETVRLEVTSRDSTYTAVADASVTVRVVDPAGALQELRPALADATAGRYVTEFTPTQKGVYQIDATADQAAINLGDADGWVLVGGADRELTDPRLHGDALARLAEATGGAVVSPEALGDLPRQLRDRSADPAPPVRHDLWHNVWVFALLVLLPSTEWIVRRQWGLR